MPTVYLSKFSFSNPEPHLRAEHTQDTCRGLGFGLVQALAANPDNIIFAGARNPSSKELAAFAAAHPEQVIPIALDSADVPLNKAAAKLIEEKVGKLDVVIANAGMGKVSTMSDIEIPEFVETFKVNVLGPLVLFQNTQQLLRKASSTGKFVTISSVQGSVSNMIPGPSGAYGASKAAVNSVTIKIQEENPDLIVFPMCPGFVATEGASKFTKDQGAPREIMNSAAPISVAAANVLKHISEAVKVDQPKTLWTARGTSLGKEVPF
ncbi:uncharacterized protein IL334_003591 [Kwoniella shivajii]|uniref:NAD(P)-binding protein n=1 Tax=Kwoniella shivajii TaxID=564305 RepID=A0ABZ1CZ63_9TREE|nr:hypothetical protein IL334_003591 [Kwoniella shivajii]